MCDKQSWTIDCTSIDHHEMASKIARHTARERERASSGHTTPADFDLIIVAQFSIGAASEALERAASSRVCAEFTQCVKCACSWLRVTSESRRGRLASRSAAVAVAAAALAPFDLSAQARERVSGNLGALASRALAYSSLSTRAARSLIRLPPFGRSSARCK